jgi:hypothetical protein
MARLLQWSLLAVSFVSSAVSTPLSTTARVIPQLSSLTLAPLVAEPHPMATSTIYTSSFSRRTSLQRLIQFLAEHA